MAEGGLRNKATKNFMIVVRMLGGRRDLKGKGSAVGGDGRAAGKKVQKSGDAADSLFDGWRLRGNIFSGIRARDRAASS